MKTTLNLPDPDEIDSGRGESGETDSPASGDQDLSALLPEDPLAGQIDQLLSGQKSQQEAIDAAKLGLQRVEKAVEKVGELLSDTRSEREALLLANKEISRLIDLHWQQHFVEPMVNQLFPLFDLVLALRATNRNRGVEGKATESAFRAVQAMLQEFLATYGIEHFLPRVGSSFEPASMKAVKVVPTDDAGQHNLVQACLQAGFKWGPGATIRAASVQVWRYRQPDRPQEGSSDRKEGTS